ncbi:MAG: HIT family protein [Bdellovibrionia bacterium]
MAKKVLNKKKNTAPKKITKQKPSLSLVAKGVAKKQIFGSEKEGYVWPLERDVLCRPDRMKYVRRLIPVEGCVFCRAAENNVQLETLCVHQTSHSMVVLNKFPYNSGHVLVIPKRHCGDLTELSSEEYLDLMDLLKMTMAALKDIYKPGGLNVGLNQGAVAGAGIPEHLHFHVIPRWAGDLNFFPLIAETKVLVESLEQTFEKIHLYFNSK